MGTLTKQERDGLEDIFLSIHANNTNYKKLKDISNLLLSKNIGLITSKVLKMAKQGLKESKISKFIALFLKKKKNLSK